MTITQRPLQSRMMALSIALTAAAAAVLPAGGAASPAQGSRPNFVLLFVDDLGFNEINLEEQAPASGGYSGYGGRVQTPHLAKFAREGMVFTDWYSGWHLCSPSRAACLTGRLPPRTGIDSVGSSVLTAEAVGGLPLNETTFAEALRNSSYRTAAIGKWHLGVRSEFMPSNRGFQYYFGVPYSVDMGLSVWHPPGIPDDKGWPYPLVPLPLVEGTDNGGWAIVEQPVALSNLTERYVEAGARFIAKSAASADPFVLYMAFNHVHDPQYCTIEFCRSSNLTGVTDAIPTGHGGTGAAVQEMDWAVGQLMEALKTAGVDDDTLVLFTSDNGAPANHVADQGDGRGSNAPFRGFKGQVWEGGIRMPAMARWPGKVQAGSSSSELVATYDVFATMLALGGASVPAGRVIDGIDLSPILLGRSEARGHDCLFQYFSGVLLAAVRCGKWKLRYDLDPIALYDLEADVGERSPVPNTTASWGPTVQRITAARDAHLMTVVPVQDQTNLGSNPKYVLCAAPNSTKTHPHLPNCTLNPENWAKPWGSAAADDVSDPGHAVIDLDN